MEVLMTEINDIMDYLQVIKRKLEDLEDKERQKIQFEHRSPEVKDLFMSLAKAQGEMNLAATDKINPYFSIKYTSLRQLVSASRPALTKYGLAVIQQIISNEEGQSILHTILTHESGQWIESTIKLTPSKTDVKTIESYTDFMRRLAYGSLVGIISQGEDDDGEIEMMNAREIVAKGPSVKYDPKRESFDTITKEQLEELEYELSEYPDIGESVLDSLRILSLADMPKSQYMKSMQRIREIKQLRNGK